jgi:uncharacterized protein YjiS (DUF1127 family)
MTSRISVAELNRLLSTPARTAETEQARGLFLSVLRLRDGLDALGITRLFARLAANRERRSAAAELYALSDRELADIGLTRSEIDRTLDETAPEAAGKAAPTRQVKRPTVVLTPPRRAAALAG